MKRACRFLDTYETLYRSSSDNTIQFLLMKLALLETAAWIEIVFDELYLSCSKSEAAREQIDKHIKRIYSFSYQNLHDTLVFCLGINTVYSLEEKYTGEKLSIFQSKLAEIKNIRDALAHNYEHTTQKLMSFEDLKKTVRGVYLAVLLIKRYVKIK
ncbi:MAG: hypothetical protein PUB86_01220 [Elusimicrobia bacterium]|nr:hypothetical protein [Elusimicrobiota bacterium]